MVRTRGAGNPVWNHDETLLVLNLYLQKSKKIPSANSKEVKELSALLQSLPFHNGLNRNDTFRNVDGVYMKMQNLDSARQQIDEGKSPRISCSKMDRQIWSEYGNQPAKVNELAERIQIASKEVSGSSFSDDEIEEDFSEGVMITRLHRMRERHRGIRAKIIEKARKIKALQCAACGTKGQPGFESANESIFEIHHIQPLSKVASAGTRTKISEVCLLCANCHKLVHRMIRDSGDWLSLEKFKAVIAANSANKSVK